MKIGFFGTRMDLVSGHSRPAFELAQRLKERGHEVRIVTSRLSPFRQKRFESMSVNSTVRVERLFDSYSDMFRGRHILKDFIQQSDIIHEFSPYGLGILPGLDIRKAPSVVSIVNNPRVSLRVYLSQGVRFLLREPEPRFLLTAVLPRRMMGYVLERATTIITWSDYTYRQVAKLGIHEDRIRHIPAGIDPTRFTIDPATNKPGAPTFLYLGPVTAIHGVDLLIKAFARFRRAQPDSHLIIADRGPDLAADATRYQPFKAYCLQLSEQEGIGKHITWQGFTADVSTLFNQADAVILPYRMALGYAQPSLTLLEALVHGKPVISTTSGAVPEIITSGENGLVITPDDLPSLVTAMNQISSGQFTLTNEQIRSRTAARHAWPAIVDAHERVYEQIMLKR